VSADPTLAIFETNEAQTTALRGKASELLALCNEVAMLGDEGGIERSTQALTLALRSCIEVSLVESGKDGGAIFSGVSSLLGWLYSLQPVRVWADLAKDMTTAAWEIASLYCKAEGDLGDIPIVLQ
jgi:hypothetical protein